MKPFRCLLGFHDWHLRGTCITRAIILAPFTPSGGDDRICRRCGFEDNDMLNCHHGHVKIDR